MPQRTTCSRPEPVRFEDFVTAHGAELVGFARRLTLDHHRGEDIVQDVLARLSMSWDRVTRADDVRAYVHKAVLNEFLSWRRRLSSHERPVGFGPDRGGTSSADETVAHQDELARLLSPLPPVQRAVVVLRYHQDRSDAEIATLLGCRESTVRSHARRALTTLREYQNGPAEGMRR